LGPPYIRMEELVKTPEQMTPRDYASLGFKCGLEVHQQLRTKKKLFCHCPNTTYSDAYDAEILRHMRPTLSELGEYDPTALMEFKTKKEITCRINRDTVCTYEMDDTPPFRLNPEALDIALEVSMLLNLNMVQEVHIARKQYLDGSIPTGFQRTTILGVNGWIPFRGRKIGIRQLGLEEDSCREVSDVGHNRTYITDRLSIPLIETVTEAEIRTPEEAAAVGQVIRALTRCTGKVRTGIGAARQDVNVSVTGGTRVEIKGVPRIPTFVALTHYEALRQRALLDIRDGLLSRGVTPETFKPTIHEVSSVVKQTHFGPVRSAVELGLPVMAVRLPGFRNVLNVETAPEATFAREFSGRVKVVACIDAMPNIIWSDCPNVTLAFRLWERVNREVGATEEDTVVLVWGQPRDVRLAADEIADRAREALLGVPSETRKALKDGSTVFERILPGPNRMYPDTDLPPIALAPERVERIRAQLPTPPWESVEKYRSRNVPLDLAHSMLLDPRRKVFDQALDIPGLDGCVVARIMGQTVRHLRRKRVGVERVSDGTMLGLFQLLAEARITSSAFPVLIAALAKKPDADLTALVDELFPVVPAQPPLAQVVTDQLRAIPEPEWRRGGDLRKEYTILMGRVAPPYRGRVRGAAVGEIVRAFMQDGGK